MAAGSRPEGRPKRRKMFVPPPVPAVIVQPPPHLEHLLGDDEAMFEALVNDRSERWYSSRAAAECGREQPTFRSWVSARYGYDERVKAAAAEAAKTGGRPRPVRRPKGRMTPPPDGYDVRSPWWYPGTLRAWFIAEKLMDEKTGKFRPYKPTGRTPGSVNRVERKTPRPMQDMGREILAACEELRAGGKSLAEARAILADRYKLSGPQIDRRLLAGRRQRAQEADLSVTPDMSPAEVAERVHKAYQLLSADGRRRNEDKIRSAVADRLGVAANVVDEVLDASPAVPVGT